MASVEELEAAIRQQPDDVDLRGVHADAMLERGDRNDRARGQLIQLALAGERGDAAAAHSAWALQRKVRARLVKALDKRYVVRMTWRHGSVESIDLEPRGWEKPKFLAMNNLGPVIDLLARPELFALRAFDTRAVGITHVETVISLVKALPIRWLGVSDHLIDGAALDLFHTLPQLDGIGLVTEDPEATVDALRDRPWLRDLELDGVPMHAALRVAEACPQLTRLVWFGGGELPDEVAPILERRVLLELRDFGIMATRSVTTSFCRRLAVSALLPQLRSLGFCATHVYDDEDTRAWFLANRTVFAHVRLFTNGESPGSDRGHDAGRLGMLLDAVDRDREGIDDQMHHLDHSGTQHAHAHCWTRLANALITIEHYDEALRMTDRALEVRGEVPHSSDAWMWRTRVHALDCLDRYAEAEAASERALSFEGDCSWTWRFRGGALRELGRFDEAAAALDRALECVKETSPASYRAWAHLLRGELRWGRRDHAAAIEDFERVLATAESSDHEALRRARVGLGSIAYLRGDFTAARPHYVEGLAVSSREDSDAIAALCVSLFRLGEHQLALTTWQIAATQFEWNDIEEQGHVLIAMGRPADALTTLAAGLECGGARALALHALGDLDDAIAAFDNYAVRPRVGDPACAFRFAIGAVLQALLLRTAGRAREATQRLSKLRELPTDPVELHAALLRKLRGHDTRGCYPRNCARHAAVAVLAAAIVGGDRARATTRARGFAAYEDAQLANHVPEIVWDVRAALRLAPSPLLAAALATLEHDAPTASILAAL